LRRRCPQCGAGSIFRDYWTLRESCPRCSYRFDREEGYFLGAYAINLIVAEFVTVAVLVYLLAGTDLSWVALEAIVIPMAVGLPILFFPFSRMFWMALDLMIDRNTGERQLRVRDVRRSPAGK
jgi:uncharacterized protein (DUF983 family)